MLEARSKGRTTDALKSLMKLAPKTAVLLRDGVETVVSIDEVVRGDIFVVRPGENIPVDGIVLEGQKTFQVKPSAFDRVNVRRLFLRLERATYKVARYFVYEGNTAYTRQRLIDTLDPIFADVKLRNGIYDYKIICDESINTPEVIDRNELKVKIGIKPVKTAEFILIDFIALTTGGSFDEM